jgi:hypothetical protein
MKYLLFFLLFASGHCQAQYDKEEYLMPYRKINLWGYSNIFGEIRIAPSFDNVSFFSSSDSSAIFQEKRGWAVVSKSGKKGLIDRQGKQILSFVYDSILPSTYRSLFSIFRNGKVGLFNAETGKVLYKEMFSGFSYLTDSLIILIDSGKMGIGNTVGRLLTKIEFDEFLDEYLVFSKKTVTVTGRKGNQLRQITIYKNSTATEKEQGLRIFSDADIMPGPTEGLQFEDEEDELKKTKISAAEIESVKKKYNVDSVSEMSFFYLDNVPNNNTFFKVFKNGKTGYWIREDSIYVNPAYDTIVSAKQVSFGIAYIIAKRENKFGILSPNGEIILPFLYDGIKVFNRQYFICYSRSDNKYKIAFFKGDSYQIKVNKNGYENVKCITIATDGFYNESFPVFKVYINGHSGYVGYKGFEYFEN